LFEEEILAQLGAAEIAMLTKDFDDNKKMVFQSQYSSDKKDRGTATILALFLYDRIWLGDIALGILKLITAGLCGIWWLIDIFTAGSRCDDYNRRKAEEIIAALKLSNTVNPAQPISPPAPQNQQQEQQTQQNQIEKTKFCTKCGAKNKGDDAFCGECGKKLD
jgi:hypothetical protein